MACHSPPDTHLARAAGIVVLAISHRYPTVLKFVFTRRTRAPKALETYEKEQSGAQPQQEMASFAPSPYLLTSVVLHPSPPKTASGRGDAQVWFSKLRVMIYAYD